MQILRVALGAVASRGAKVAAPALVVLPGTAEQNFLARHVEKVREDAQAGRSRFASKAAVPGLLAGLRGASDPAFVAGAGTLQQMLATAMAASTSPSDCVTAVIEAKDQPADRQSHLTLLKLDANVEAARRDIQGGVVNLKVLSDLLPSPGDLQKALSWPDPRPTSDALVIDMNADTAQYFAKAYEVEVSLRSRQAEAELQAAIVDLVPQSDLSRALADAAALDGPSDQVIAALAQTHPSLGAAAQQAGAATRPAGIIRRGRAAAKPVVWKADGVELRVPASRASDVQVVQVGAEYELRVRVRTRPVRSL